MILNEEVFEHDIESSVKSKKLSDQLKEIRYLYFDGRPV
jgi:hypothetical protein